jgi:hypothetical protein
MTGPVTVEEEGAAECGRTTEVVDATNEHQHHHHHYQKYCINSSTDPSMCNSK